MHELESFFIVGGDLFRNDLRAVALFDVATSDRKHVERTKTEEVHLEKAQVGRVVTIVLGDDAAALGVALHGHVIGHGVAADDGGARVHALAAHVAFDGFRRIDHRVHVGLVFVGLGQIRIGLERLVDRDAELVADHLADAVTRAVRIVEHARGIAHSVFRLKRAEGDHLRNVVFAIHILDVVDNFFTPTLLEVDVDIGHLHTFGREEALEHEAVGQRIEVGDAHGVCHDRACRRTTARANADALAARPFDVFLHDQEVGGEALIDNDLHLVVGLLLHVLGNGITVALDQAFLHALAEP